MPSIRLLTLHLVPAGLTLAMIAPATAQTLPADQHDRAAGLTTIDVPGAAATVALDINASGDIVGRYTSAVDGNEHGFWRSRHGLLFSIDVPGAVFTVAAGTNNVGDIVGQYRLPSDGARVRRGYLLSKGMFAEINPPGAAVTNVLGIGPSGRIVGRFCTTAVNPCASESTDLHGFLFADGEYSTIDVPDAMGTNAWKTIGRGKIIGGYTGSNGDHHVFLLTHRGFTDVEVPPDISLGLDNGGINSAGDIVGFYCDSEPCTARSADTHGFLLRRNEFRAVDIPGATLTVAFSINNRGDIVGLYGDASGKIHGFVLRGRP